eukprot:CAMPEP_0194210510 /NCGR_PEP_ID=MMETSP0156-20130528/8635_1 /TAXON_ID=33649 /ORGANISM="Thalassionema nitzschioides, Strain L26-B" /LENGTH=435 /DNA_ID=CAMNT_0038937867 /DNA_START=132 /DNA_END=1439 /DNA_ORIENTATION=-
MPPSLQVRRPSASYAEYMEPALNTKLSAKAINDHVGKQATTESRRVPRRQSMPLVNHAPPQPVKKAPAISATSRRMPRRQSMPLMNQTTAEPVKKAAANPRLPRMQSMPKLNQTSAQPVKKTEANNSPSRRIPRRQSMPLLNRTPPQPVKKASANRTSKQQVKAPLAPYSSSIFPKPAPKNLEALKEAFPGAIPISQLVGHVTATLAHHDYGSSTLLATSLCCDEVNRDLEREFVEHYGEHFSMGGLAGFPFGGITSFNAMAHHIPDGGSSLLVYGPHVGIDRAGNVGTVERRGRLKSGACCGSANAAADYACAVHNGLKKIELDFSQGMDIEQHFVGQMLLPHGRRLERAKNMKVEVPYICYEEQTTQIHKIVETCCGEVAGNGKIALLGGIQINTPFEQEDYFLPLGFELQCNEGKLIDKFEEAFLDGAEIMA